MTRRRRWVTPANTQLQTYLCTDVDGDSVKEYRPVRERVPASGATSSRNRRRERVRQRVDSMRDSGQSLRAVVHGIHSGDVGEERLDIATEWRGDGKACAHRPARSPTPRVAHENAHSKICGPAFPGRNDGWEPSRCRR